MGVPACWGRCLWSLLAATASLPAELRAAYPEHPARDIVVLNPWVLRYENGSTFEVQLPHTFPERAQVEYEFQLSGSVGSDGLRSARGALVKFTCSLRCSLFVDEVFVSGNDNTYLPVFAKLPASAQSLRLSVDSRFLGRHSMHQLQYDWWQPGGIFNPVELHLMRSENYLQHVAVYPLAFPKVHIKISATTKLPVAVSFDSGEAFVAAEEAFEVDVPNARPWSPEAPELHMLTVYLLAGNSPDALGSPQAPTAVLDAVVTRFGLRQVEARQGQVHLNGQPVRLLGVNRHHFGPAGVLVSEEDIREDVHFMKDLGANFLRGAHYPQDPRLLDACDEAGILVWEESLAWQNTVQELNNESWLGAQKEQLERMARASANHPSVIIYGFLNEGASDHPASVFAYKALADTVRAADPTRLVGWASSVTTRDLAWEFADVIGFNDYTGWYPTTQPADVEDLKYVPSIWSYYHDWVKEHFPGKALIASEFGAGGQLGRRGSALAKWTEECQALLLQLHLLGALHADVAGIAIWLLADSPVDPSTDEVYRPGGVNDKGLLSVDRKPKLAYGAIRAIFGGHRGLMLPSKEQHLLKELEA